MDFQRHILPADYARSASLAEVSRRRAIRPGFVRLRRCRPRPSADLVVAAARRHDYDSIETSNMIVLKV